MRIVFFGTPEFAVSSLESLVESDNEILLTISQPDRPKGRGHKISQPPVKEFALSRGINVNQPQSISSRSFIEELSKLNPDIIIVVAYGKIIPPAILNLPSLGCVNVHASLLPKYRGAAPIQWAIMNGETKTGITTMLMDEGLDTGHILLQAETEITDEDTSYSLSQKLSALGASLLVKTVRGLDENSIQPRPQSGEPSFAPPLKKENGKIDWSKEAKRICDLVRATYPWPGAFSYLNDEKVIILKTKPIHTDVKSIPGKIEKISLDGIYVGTGDGILSIIELKPQGKKVMSFSSFLQGRPIREGVFFESV
jgi:methionyl-tRNA formyltransferase